MNQRNIVVYLFILCGFAIPALGQPADLAIHSDQVDVTRGEVTANISREPFALEALLVEGSDPFVWQGLVYGEEREPVRIQRIDRRTEGAVFYGKAGNADVSIQASLQGSQLRVDVHTSGEASAPQLVLACRPDEHFYGLGDYWGPGQLDMRGQSKRLWVRTGTPDECAYVPFYLSTHGYGLFLDDPRGTTFDFGATTAEEVRIQAGAPNFTFYVFLDDAMLGALQQYQQLTGLPYQPPRWTFTPQKWRNEGNWDAVWQDVNAMREHDIPLGVVWIDRPWALGDYGAADFEFDPVRYPNPQENIDKLHDLGIRVLVWACDATTPDAKNATVARENGYLANDSGGLLRIDFTDPEAWDWWKSEIHKVLDMGIDGFKLDRGQTLPGNADHAAGWDHDLMHNYHGYLMTKIYAEALQEAHGDDFQFTPRASWSGNQQYTMKWPGDIDATYSSTNGMGSCVIAQQSAAMTGFGYWGSDIGGFEQNDQHPTKECFIRWVQFGAFSPVMQTCGKRRTDPAPFNFDDETVEIYRQYAKLRMELLPYIETMARKTSGMGIPMVRPLALEFENDPNTHTLWDQYMFGSHFLVAPILSDTRTREVYLPEGTRWMNYWDSSQTYNGGQTVKVEAPLNQIPLFVRMPFVLPLEVSDNTAGNGAVRVENVPTVLLSGSGTDFAWESYGTNWRVDTNLVESAATKVRVRTDGDAKPVLFRILDRGLTEVAGLSQSDPEALASGNPGWWKDPESGEIWVLTDSAFTVD